MNNVTEIRPEWQLRVVGERVYATAAGYRGDVDTVAYVGRPAPTILEYAKAGGFDLIVMGTHGRTGLSHLITGSVAEQVLRAAPCAVLTVRGNGAARVHLPTARPKAA